MRNKRGWVEIVEAFIAVLLIAGVLIVIVNTTDFGKGDLSQRVYETQLSILREIQTDDTLRGEIASSTEELPIIWENPNFPAGVKSKITERIPNYLECVGRICSIDATCVLDETRDKDVYSQSVVITATLESGAVYRTLNLFCWTKG